MSKPTGLEKEKQGLKGIPQIARKSPTSWQKLEECYAQLLAGGKEPGAFSLPRCPPGHPLQVADVRAQLTPNYLHPAQRGKKQQPPASEISWKAPQRNIKDLFCSSENISTLQLRKLGSYAKGVYNKRAVGHQEAVLFYFPAQPPAEMLCVC